jgi:hypothetical protein
MSVQLLPPKRLYKKSDDGFETAAGIRACEENARTALLFGAAILVMTLLQLIVSVSSRF